MKHFTLFLFLILLTLACSEDGMMEEMPREITIAEQLEFVLNSSGYAPLSGQLMVRSSELCTVDITIEGDTPISYSSTTDSVHVLDIHGLYAGTVNTLSVRLELLNGDYEMQVLSVETDPLPDIFPDFDIRVSDDEGRFILLEAGLCDNNSSMGYPMIIDHTGSVRWYSNLSRFGIILLPLTPVNDDAYVTAKQDSVFVINKFGETEDVHYLSQYLSHHDIQVTSNGLWVLLVSKKGIQTIEDFMILYDPVSRQVLKEWDFRQILDVDRTDIGNNPADWLHANSVQYIEETNNFVISARHQGVFKMDYEGHLEWILSGHHNWDFAGLNGEGEDTRDFLLMPSSAEGLAFDEAVVNGFEPHPDFDWSWTQHGAYLEDDLLYVFDNGAWRHYESQVSPDSYSRGVIFQIDASSKTVTQWKSFREVGDFSFAMGDIDSNDGEVFILSPLDATDQGPQAHLYIYDQNTGALTMHIDVSYRATNCMPGQIFGSFDFIYQAELVSF